MIDKFVRSVAEALGRHQGRLDRADRRLRAVGEPRALIDGLIEQGAKDLPSSRNNAGRFREGAGAADRRAPGAQDRVQLRAQPRLGALRGGVRAGEIELEIVPQGTMAERIRAAAAGIPAFFTATGAGTKLAQGKEARVFDGREYILEHAIRGDVALVEAWRADRWGNLVYRDAGRNFNPVMAAAAELTIAQTQHVAELGDCRRGDRHPRHLCRPPRARRGRRPAAAVTIRDSCEQDDRSRHVNADTVWQADWKPLNAMRWRGSAHDIPEGWSVNLGIGIPTLVGNYVPPEREVVFHSENGIVGMGPAPPPDQINRWLINASSQYVTLRPGGSYMSHSDSFALVRGGHLDLCVLGAFQVAENGDLANWARSEDDNAPAIGGAMDLAAGAKRIWIVMEHNTRSGEARLLRRCTYPLTAPVASSASTPNSP